MQGIGMAVDQCVLQQLLADDMHSNQQVPYLVSLSSNTLAELAFPAWFSRACRSHQRSPEQFQFLISEIDMHSHDRQVRAFCQRLEALGISWQLTDFGSAMDPLAVLAQVKPAAVMLDPALLRDLQYSKSQQDTLEKLTAAIHACGMSVLATQLENADQLPRLFRLGIDGVQGNCLQTPRPLPDYGFPQNRTLGSTA